MAKRGRKAKAKSSEPVYDKFDGPVVVPAYRAKQCPKCLRLMGVFTGLDETGKQRRKCRNCGYCYRATREVEK